MKLLLNFGHMTSGHDDDVDSNYHETDEEDVDSIASTTSKSKNTAPESLRKQSICEHCLSFNKCMDSSLLFCKFVTLVFKYN